MPFGAWVCRVRGAVPGRFPAPAAPTRPTPRGSAPMTPRQGLRPLAPGVRCFAPLAPMFGAPPRWRGVQCFRLLAPAFGAPLLGPRRSGLHPFGPPAFGAPPLWPPGVRGSAPLAPDLSAGPLALPFGAGRLPASTHITHPHGGLGAEPPGGDG
ncbi:hypothetical protein GCM10010344_16740 [Streptomyces bluensis]|nr:hypothetical protein GCM10010344_16740 [Streptomyces bluensis]